MATPRWNIQFLWKGGVFRNNIQRWDVEHETLWSTTQRWGIVHQWDTV
jgi:hypothetical protein